jgi:hypothetical protein
VIPTAPAPATSPAAWRTRQARAAGVLLAGAAVALAACGAPGAHQDVSTGAAPKAPAGTAAPKPPAGTAAPKPPAGTAAPKPSAGTAATKPAGATTPRSPSTVAPCRSGVLRADQVPLQGGTGVFVLAWSLTNTSGASCSVTGGRPTLAFVDAAGRSIVSYTDAALPSVPAPAAAASAPATSLVVVPGRAVWFSTEETDSTCGVGTTVAGGPFAYRLTLPGGTVVDWTAPYLHGPTLADVCARVPLGVGSLQADRPSAG